MAIIKKEDLKMKKCNPYKGFVASIEHFVVGYSQRKLAELVNLTEGTISKILSGDRKIIVCQNEDGEYYLVEFKVISK